METQRYRFVAAGSTRDEALAQVDAAFFRHLAKIPGSLSPDEWIEYQGGERPHESYGAHVLELAPGSRFIDAEPI